MLFAACEHHVVYDVDYNITLDPGNTYYAGDPVRFNFTGDVDNILFYSGEIGSQYMYRDRYEVPVESVISADMEMTILSQYGKNSGLSIYVTDSFDGLTWTDGAADRLTMETLFNGGMEGWDKIEYQDAAGGDTQTITVPISRYLDNFCIAFHWTPVRNGKDAQRTYKLNGNVSLELEGLAPASMDFKDMGFNVLAMNGELDPYHKNSGNGSVVVNANDYDIRFQGVGGTDLDYALDAWCISTPMSLNRVSNDRGTVIKDLQNYMDSFEYTWNEPGTYTVTFVGINSNYAGSSEEIMEFTITIMDR